MAEKEKQKDTLEDAVARSNKGDHSDAEWAEISRNAAQQGITPDQYVEAQKKYSGTDDKKEK